jgi:hypothetical protein
MALETKRLGRVVEFEPVKQSDDTLVPSEVFRRTVLRIKQDETIVRWGKKNPKTVRASTADQMIKNFYKKWDWLVLDGQRKLVRVKKEGD